MGEKSTEMPDAPGPAMLPGVEGFYVLRASGEVGRYQPDGRFVPEPELSRSLTDQVNEILRLYRAGQVSELVLGLVTADLKDREWRTASLVLTDHALREIYRTSGDQNAPLTNFQKRNRIKSLFQGMEVIMDARDPNQPEYPRHCPLFFAPEVDTAALARRYGVEDVAPDRVLEVLDLIAPLDPESRRAPVFSRMVLEVSRSRISPELRTGPELMVVAGAGPEIEPFRPRAGHSEDPWVVEPEERSISFNDGDTVPYWLLAWFSPFNQLNDLQRQFIARGLTITKRPPGTVFVERGTKDDVSLYLVEGTLELEAFDGRKINIKGGTKRAHIPISQLSPHAYTVRADTAVTVIIIRQSMVRQVTRITTTYGRRAGIEVTEEGPMADGLGHPSSSGGGGGYPR